jgi:hypothetical protein
VTQRSSPRNLASSRMPAIEAQVEIQLDFQVKESQTSVDTLMKCQIENADSDSPIPKQAKAEYAKL